MKGAQSAVDVIGMYRKIKDFPKLWDRSSTIVPHWARLPVKQGDALPT